MEERSVKKDKSSASEGLSQAEVARIYDRLARVYDLWALLTESKARKRSLGLADVRDGGQILEVAAGTGLAFVEIVRRNPGGRNVALDLSAGMLARTESRLRRAGCRNFELRRASAFEIPEEADSFDVILNSYMFDLLSERDWPKALGEFHRVLKPEGRLVVVNMTPGERPGSGIYERIYRWSPRLMGGCRGVRLSEALRENNFSVLLREYCQQFLFPAEVILARKADSLTAPAG